MPSPFDAWISTCRFGVEAQQVIATRLLRSMRCDAAASVEAARMVNEKVAAFIEGHAAAGLAFATGKTPDVAVGEFLKPYRRRANRRRLNLRQGKYP